MADVVSRLEFEEWARSLPSESVIGYVNAHTVHPVCSFLTTHAPGWIFYVELGPESPSFLGGVDGSGGWFELEVGWVARFDRALRATVAPDPRYPLQAVTAAQCVAALTAMASELGNVGSRRA